jgi:DNA-binding response OmpR family regulator
VRVSLARTLNAALLSRRLQERLVDSVWDSNVDVEDNLIDVLIYQLRKKVDRDQAVKLIKTVIYLGYTIRDPTRTR